MQIAIMFMCLLNIHTLCLNAISFVTSWHIQRVKENICGTHEQWAKYYGNAPIVIPLILKYIYGLHNYAESSKIFSVLKATLNNVMNWKCIAKNGF